MRKRLENSFEMASALISISKDIEKNRVQFNNMEEEINQQDYEIDLLIDKLIELEKENMYLRILLNKLLSDSEYTLEGLLDGR